MIPVTVVTCAIPERLDMLFEATESVKNQTVSPYSHLISIDYQKVGTARNLNNACFGVTTEFFAILADDDLLYPDHLKILYDNSKEADVVYSFAEVSGRGERFANRINREFDEKLLRKKNFICATTLIRTEMFRQVGGFPNDIKEDYGLWLKFLDVGAVFKCVPEKTWVYRFHGDNKSYRSRR